MTAPEGFSVVETPLEVTTLLGGMAWGQHDGPDTEGYCKPIWSPRPHNCIRVVCNRCGSYWDGPGPDFVKAVTFHGSHQRLCRKRPMSQVHENLDRFTESILGESPGCVADYIVAQELDYAAREYGEHPWTYQHFQEMLQKSAEKRQARLR